MMGILAEKAEKTAAEEGGEEEEVEPDNYNYLSTRACDLVLEHLCATGQANEAFNIFNGMGHIVPRSTLSYNTMIRGLGMHGKVSMAQKLFDTMLPFGTTTDPAPAVGDGDGGPDDAVEDDGAAPLVPVRDQDSYDFMVDAYFKKMESDPDSRAALEALMAEMKSTDGLRVNTWPFGKVLPGVVPKRKRYQERQSEFYRKGKSAWR